MLSQSEDTGGLFFTILPDFGTGEVVQSTILGQLSGPERSSKLNQFFGLWDSSTREAALDAVAPRRHVLISSR